MSFVPTLQVFDFAAVLLPAAAALVALVFLGRIAHHLKSIARSLDAGPRDPR